MIIYVYMSSTYVEYLSSLEWLTQFCTDVESNIVIVFVETLETNNCQNTINLH